MFGKLREREIFADEFGGWRIRHWSGIGGAVENWGEQMVEGMQVFCMNLGGDLLVLGGRSRMHLVGGMSGTFRIAPGFRGMTMAGSTLAIEFLTIEIVPEWIRKQFPVGLDSLPKERRGMWTDAVWDVSLPARLMVPEERILQGQLLDPPVDGFSRIYWYRAKILEFLSLQLFRSDDSPFCSRQQQAVRERVAGALTALRESLEDPLDLQALAENAGVSPATLSRLVSVETGKTLSLHLRAMRVERALELMKHEGFNVTKAAMEVGYSSLSHFTKACVSETGAKPSEFLK